MFKDKIDMTTMTLQVPDALEKEHDETVRLIAAKLYEAGKLSLSQAAEMCGMKKWDFPAILAKLDIPYFQYTGDDLLNEFK
jgi:predicted HTH domain antitoxin